MANKMAKLSLASGAGKAGLLYILSISFTKFIEKIAAAGLPNQTVFHQEHIWSNMSQLQDELIRIEKGGYKAIFLAVDNTGVNGICTRV